MWEFYCDIGGTFTDCIGLSPDGSRQTVKTLSTTQDGRLSPVVAIAKILGQNYKDTPIRLHLGTTAGTNALLERKGDNVALFVTKGFGDITTIRDGRRRSLFSLNESLPAPLETAVIEVPERTFADGKIDQQAMGWRASKGEREILANCSTIAIALLHSPVNKSNEEWLAEHLQSLPETAGKPIFTSYATKVRHYLKRAETTIIDAYLSSSLTAYKQELAKSLPRADIKIMNSDGYLTNIDAFTGKDSILSGPAGGMAACVASNRTYGRAAVAFDMGGTSTDVAWVDQTMCRVDETQFQNEMTDVFCARPSVAMSTIASGGGSIITFANGLLRVGPESAGASPGPACYGRGGPLTVTDCQLLLGRIQANRFPFPLNRQASVQKAVALCPDRSPEDLAQEAIALTAEQTANAIRRHLIKIGKDATTSDLLAFGGAAGQIACDVADRLGFDKIRIPRNAPIFSAHGMAVAEFGSMEAQDIQLPYGTDARTRITQLFGKHNKPEHLLLRVGYKGQSHTLLVPWEHWETIPQELRTDFIERFGYHIEEQIFIQRLEIHRLHTPSKKPTAPDISPQAIKSSANKLIHVENSVIFVKEHWRAIANEHGDIVLQRAQHSEPAQHSSHQPTSALVWEKLQGIAEQMGERLAQSTQSVNIRDRRDFSCAIFDDQGQLIVNAPHVPVHLGAMGETVRACLASHQMNDGDIWLTNDPAHGGSHLPDVTVLMPIFDHQRQRQWFVATRAHHAEIGGKSPGSMPFDSQTLDEEGVVLPMTKIASAAAVFEDRIMQMLANAPYPSRDPQTNLRDIKAQIAALHFGKMRLQEEMATFGTNMFRQATRNLLQISAQETQRCLKTRLTRLSTRHDIPLVQSHTLDNDARIEVKFMTEGGKFVFDFSASTECRDNFHAPRCVTRACVMYALRVLIDNDIPMNEGLLAPIEIRFSRASSILTPPPGSPVAAGNVETSQALVDLLLGIFRIAAPGQGTMNNVILGNESFGVYETIGGGMGASLHPTPRPGIDARQCHMTNTGLTDVEVLEHNYPLQILETSIRRQSGEPGLLAGGNGLTRRYRPCVPTELNLITSNRNLTSRRRGRNSLHFADGKIESLPHACRVFIQPPTILEVQTPGGCAIERPKR